jgi:hypothetical protein
MFQRSSSALLSPATAALARLLVLAALVASTVAPLMAAVCDSEPRPAATLLLPYFEVNLDDPNGLTTLFSVNNASAVAVLAHATIWSDLAVPVLEFNLYLTGYDVQTINLRDILVSGVIPRTASAAQDPSDIVSPKGAFSQDINFASCVGQLPPQPMPAAFITHLQRSLTGKSSALFNDRCAGRFLGDNIARGYITVDTVNNCTLRFPGDPDYFGPHGDVSDQNVLWGSFFIVDSTNTFAQGANLVAIEADATNPATSTPGRYTFYGRYDNWTAIDHREPLPTSFATQYVIGGAFAGGTDAIVWRDSKVITEPLDCPIVIGLPGVPGTTPPGYPLPQESLSMFDEQEHPWVRSQFCDWFPLPCETRPSFIAATQRVRVGGTVLPVPFDFGWLYIDLNFSSPTAGANPPFDPSAGQAWVITTLSANGRFAVGLDGFRLDSGCSPRHDAPY